MQLWISCIQIYFGKNSNASLKDFIKKFLVILVFQLIDSIAFNYLIAKTVAINFLSINFLQPLINSNRQL